MKIKLYIVTYNNNEVLNNWALKSLSNSDFDRDKVDIFVINNHSNIRVDEEFKDFVTVLSNELRPDFSTGHLARNWNQAIINGFQNLNNPDCDIVIACQNDTVFKKQWYFEVCEILKTYQYITFGRGDCLQIFTPEAIKKIGIFDERICNIGYQEADYFFRAGSYFRQFSSINDDHHGRVLNLVENNVIEVHNSEEKNFEFHLKSFEMHPFSQKVVESKWGFIPTSLDESICNENVSPNFFSFFYYPYFEKDIYEETKIKQKYLT